MLSFIYLILILGLLIFVHEFGHFIAAKKIGVYVSEFSLGMGPVIFSFKRKKKKDPTVYSLRLFPIGGFCAMAGEVEEDEDELKLKKNQYMCNRSRLERIIILAAGVTMNILLAIVLLFLQALIWGHGELKSVVNYIQLDYPAMKAGMLPGDTILEVNGYKVNTWDKLQLVLNYKNKSGEYRFKVMHKDGKKETLKIIPTKEKMEDGNERIVFGFGAGDTIYKGFLNSVKYAFSKLGSTMSSMYLIILNLFTGKISINSLSGPVGMYTVVDGVKNSLNSLIYLAGYLSINLAVLNFLPFPAFDGGRALFVFLEYFTGKKIDSKVEGWFHTIGFILLMLLMVIITVKDILKLI